MSSRKQRNNTKRGPSTVEETRVPSNRQRLKEVTQVKLDFSLNEAFSPANAKVSSTTTKAPPVDVKIIVASEHLAIMIPAFDQDGWVDNLNKAIALAKNVGMVGFKLPDGIASFPNRFGYYNYFEDADYTMKELFDIDSDEVVKDGVTVGRTDTEKGTVSGLRIVTSSHSNTACAMYRSESERLLGHEDIRSCQGV